MTLNGGCYCGAVRYEVTEDPVLRAQCHCRACQYVSGGGPNYFMLIPPNGFRFTKGKPNHFARADLDQAVTREFCSACGTHLTTRRQDLTQVVLKIGTLDDPAIFGGPQMAIHACEKQNFHLFPDGVPVFDTLPPRR